MDESLDTELSLRQFCRLLLADRLFGDELTSLTLASMKSVDPGAEPLRVAAFQRLFKIWRQAANQEGDAALFSNTSLLNGIGSPPSEIQTALLLSDVLQFNNDEIAAILGPNTNSVMEMVITGRVMFAGSAKGSVVIVEDEPIIASDLRIIIERLGADVKGTAANAPDAVSLILKHKPNAILLDYNLDGDATGLDIFHQIRDDHDCAVIFVTAFPEKILTGSDREPDIVIAKPYTEEGIRAAIAHSLSIRRAKIQHD